MIDSTEFFLVLSLIGRMEEYGIKPPYTIKQIHSLAEFLKDSDLLESSYIGHRSWNKILRSMLSKGLITVSEDSKGTLRITPTSKMTESGASEGIGLDRLYIDPYNKLATNKDLAIEDTTYDVRDQLEEFKKRGFEFSEPVKRRVVVSEEGEANYEFTVGGKDPLGRDLKYSSSPSKDRYSREEVLVFPDRKVDSHKLSSIFKDSFSATLTLDRDNPTLKYYRELRDAKK